MTVEDGHDVLSHVTVGIANDERRPAEDTKYSDGPNEEPRLFAHLADYRVGRRLVGLDDATRRTPDRIVTLAHKQDAAGGIKHDARYRGQEEAGRSQTCPQCGDVR